MEELTKLVLFNTLSRMVDSLFFLYAFYNIALVGISSNYCVYCCCDGTKTTCKSPGADRGWRKWIVDVFRALIGMKVFDYLAIFLIYVWKFYSVKNGFVGFVWDELDIPRIVSFLSLLMCYCLLVISRKRCTDDVNSKRSCCKCYDHVGTIVVAEASIAATDDDEKKQVLVKTYSGNCGCCCCSGDDEAGDGSEQSTKCRLSGGVDQDPKMKVITKWFKVIGEVSVLFQLGIFLIYLFETSGTT